MKIYDISQEVFTCDVFPGDMSPQRHILNEIDDGTIYNLTGITMCAHNGTHVDAPYHFYKDGKTIDEIDLCRFVGKCYVVFREGALDKRMAEEILEEARSIDVEASKRILIGGDIFVTLEAAQVFAENKIYLVGNESQTVGPLEGPAAVHYELLKAEVVLLEGIRLANIKEGVYLLNAAPINLGHADGAPCRAILMNVSKKKTKKKSGAIIAAAVVTVLILLWDIFIIVMSKYDPMPMSVVLIMTVPATLVIVGILVALVQRMKEIDKGEEDEAVNY